MPTPADRKRREERVKLMATALSNTGVAAVVTGLIGPLVTGRAVVAVGVGALLLGSVLHLLGQVVLHEIVADDPEDA